MAHSPTLLCVTAHPDDESLAFGGTLALCAARGAAVYLLVATRGERGWFGDPAANPGPAALGRLREAELRAAAQVLGVAGLSFMDYVDGELDQADPGAAMACIAGHLQRLQPQVVITFGPDGAYGHPDHMAVCQLTTGAIVRAAAEGFCLAKLYYRAFSALDNRRYQAAFGDICLRVDGGERRPVDWPEWMATARLDARAHWRTVWQAVQCHRSQLPANPALFALSDHEHELLWGEARYVRAYSLVNGGRALEIDLFEGIEAQS